MLRNTHRYRHRHFAISLSLRVAVGVVIIVVGILAQTTITYCVKPYKSLSCYNKEFCSIKFLCDFYYVLLHAAVSRLVIALDDSTKCT